MCVVTYRSVVLNLVVKLVDTSTQSFITVEKSLSKFLVYLK
jgi:hypothetical protein